MKKNLRTASICVQGGYEAKNGEPIEVPIIQSTTFKYTPIRDKIAISCMLRQIPEFSSHAIRHGLYIKNRKRLFCP